MFARDDILDCDELHSFKCIFVPSVVVPSRTFLKNTLTFHKQFLKQFGIISFFSQLIGL